MQRCKVTNNDEWEVIHALLLDAKIDVVGWPWPALSSNYVGISRDSADLGANDGETNEDRPLLSETELQSIKCAFRRCIDYVDIAGRSSVMWRQTKVWREKQLFSGKMRQHVENDRRYVQSYY